MKMAIEQMQQQPPAFYEGIYVHPLSLLYTGKGAADLMEIEFTHSL